MPHPRHMSPNRKGACHQSCSSRHLLHLWWRDIRESHHSRMMTSYPKTLVGWCFLFFFWWLLSSSANDDTWWWYLISAQTCWRLQHHFKFNQQLLQRTSHGGTVGRCATVNFPRQRLRSSNHPCKETGQRLKSCLQRPVPMWKDQAKEPPTYNQHLCMQ